MSVVIVGGTGTISHAVVTEAVTFSSATTPA